MIPLVEESSKKLASITDLRNWDKNPRGIKTKDFERLKLQIGKLGQYKPLLVTPEGEVLGGNMRLRAYQELGIKKIWVSVVYPKTEAEKVEYALSDNDRAGYYEDDKLAELIYSVKDEIPLELYKVDLSYPVELQTVLDNFSGNKPVTPPEQKEPQKSAMLHTCPACGHQFSYDKQKKDSQAA